MDSAHLSCLIVPRVRQRPGYAPKRGVAICPDRFGRDAHMHPGLWYPRGPLCWNRPPHRLEEQRGPTKVQEAIHHPRCKQTGPCGGRASPKASLPSPKDLSRSTKTKQCRRLKQTNQCSKGEGKITTPKQQRDHPRPVHTPHPPAPGQRYCQGTSRSGLSRGVYRLPESDHLCHRTHRFRKKKDDPTLPSTPNNVGKGTSPKPTRPNSRSNILERLS